jgi:hypothetical protein
MNNSTGQAEPIGQKRESEVEKSILAVESTTALIGESAALVDGDPLTNAEFDIDRDEGHAIIVLTSNAAALTSETLKIDLGEHSAMPNKVAIYAEINSEWKTVVAPSDISGGTSFYNTWTLNFPGYTSSRWKVELWHTQPLRLREITVVDATATVVSSGTSVIWLAQPNTTYTLYADAATQPNIQTTESPDLTSDPETIIEATLGTSLENPSFVEPDDDSDGVADFKDNCIKVANTDQTDLDQDQLGDLCEDHDADGLIASKDNCPDITNSNQTDTDEDGIGDVCDTEESRVTERLPWLPWVGMGLAALVVIGVIAGSLRREKI